MIRRLLTSIILTLGFAGLEGGQASAASLCAAPAGIGGCYATIQSAVNAAAAGDTVTVVNGTYTESVSISKAITLQGLGSGSIIDATGLRTGITITGTSGVTIANLTIEHAGAMGIDVESSSNITLTNNVLTNNNLNLTPSATCSGAPAPEQDDCGGAVFLNNVSNSTISGNTITKNADGLTLTDEAGPSFGNTLSNNTVTYNGPECGIVLASHNGKAPNGVYNNTVANNISSNNGASGVGIFSPFPGTAAHDNIVTGNVLNGNGHAGVTLHTHAPGTNDNNNQITNNSLSGNNTGGDDSAGVGRTAAIILAAAVNPIMGTVISNNTINGESIGIFLGNAVGTTMSGNTNVATLPIVTATAGALPNPKSTAVGNVTATPYVWTSGPGMASAFAVSFTTANESRAEVLFGSSCNGLISTATQDTFAGTTQHWVLVTGDDLSSTGAGLSPGATYYYEVLSFTSGGTLTDNNGGSCYTVTLPKTTNSTGTPAPPTPGT